MALIFVILLYALEVEIRADRIRNMAVTILLICKWRALEECGQGIRWQTFAPKHRLFEFMFNMYNKKECVILMTLIFNVRLTYCFIAKFVNCSISAKVSDLWRNIEKWCWKRNKCHKYCKYICYKCRL